MHDYKMILFYVVGSCMAVFFLRPIYYKLKIINYIKSNHRKHYDDKIQLFVGGTGFGGTPVEQLIEGIIDPNLNNYVEEYRSVIKQIMIGWLVGAGVIIMLILIKYIYK